MRARGLFARGGRLRGVALAGLLLAVGAAAKLPVELSLAAEQARLRYGGARMTREIRDQIGQGAALALLSGFRGPVADFLWIAAHGAWEKKEWARMRALFELVCTLQPRSVVFWEMSAWHLAWNVSHAALYDSDEPRLARRVKAQRDWILAGRAMLERGVENIPDRYELWFQLGFLLDQKLRDSSGAAEAYRRAAGFVDAPAYIQRNVGYKLEEAGRLEEAYAWWRDLWRRYPDKSGPKFMMWDKVEERMRKLEKRLGLPSGAGAAAGEGAGGWAPKKEASTGAGNRRD